MYNISEIAKRDLGAMYEWLKDIIIPQAIGMPLPAEFAYQKGRKYKWAILDDQCGLPNGSQPCFPLLKTAFTNGVDK